MGLGKTVQLLALLAAESDRRPTRAPTPTLLVCPMSLVGNWQREAARFTPDAAGARPPRRRAGPRRAFAAAVAGATW